MVGIIKEDWERVHFSDEMYLKEAEWQEREHFATEPKRQLPAIIRVMLPKFVPNEE